MSPGFVADKWLQNGFIFWKMPLANGQQVSAPAALRCVHTFSYDWGDVALTGEYALHHSGHAHGTRGSATDKVKAYPGLEARDKPGPAPSPPSGRNEAVSRESVAIKCRDGEWAHGNRKWGIAAL